MNKKERRIAQAALEAVEAAQCKESARAKAPAHGAIFGGLE
jgi:hypothetical protein